MKFTLITLVSSVLTISMGGVALAGTGTCTATNGAIITGGTCCAALAKKGSSCTCNESDAAVNGIVTCTHKTIKDGATTTINLVQPKTPKLSAPTTSPGTTQPTPNIKN